MHLVRWLTMAIAMPSSWTYVDTSHIPSLPKRRRWKSVKKAWRRPLPSSARALRARPFPSVAAGCRKPATEKRKTGKGLSKLWLSFLGDCTPGFGCTHPRASRSSLAARPTGSPSSAQSARRTPPAAPTPSVPGPGQRSPTPPPPPRLTDLQESKPQIRGHTAATPAKCQGRGSMAAHQGGGSHPCRTLLQWGSGRSPE